ncbi:hypothetical protein ACF06D_21050 [Streptomyces griseoluteus]|nr:hypothetical protein [Streptomyces recifensis]
MRCIEPWFTLSADGYGTAAATGVVVPARDRAELPDVIEGLLVEDPAS